MNLRQLQYLVAAADAGSVSGAARTLGVSQPVVSRALRNLEREYQVALFRLSGRSLGLTEAGRAVVTSARNALDAIEDVDRTAHRAAVGAALVLVSTPTNTALLSPILTQFVKNRPDTAVRLCRAGDIDEVCTVVARREAELGFGDVGDRSDTANLRVELIGQVNVVVVSPIGTHLPRAVSVDSLSSVPLVLPPSASGRRRLIDDLITAAGGQLPVPAFVTDERAAWISSAQQGVGSFLSYRAVAEELPGVELRPLDPPQNVDVGFVYRPDELSSEARELLHLARACPTLMDLHSPGSASERVPSDWSRNGSHAGLGDSGRRARTPMS
jgi:DNA-binding transcriptional LysR family regulator